MTPSSTWPPRSYLLAAADLTRAATVFSFLYAVAVMGGVAAALFALVLLGVTLPRVFRLPPVLDVSLCAVVLVAAWSALLDWYLAHPWLDVVVHLVATGLLAVTVYVALVRIGVLHAPESSALANPRAGAVLSVAALGLALGVLWELGEWCGRTFLDPRIQTGYDDTIGDLAMGGLGALLAGVVLVRTAVSRRHGSPPDDPDRRSRPVDRVRHQ